MRFGHFVFDTDFCKPYETDMALKMGHLKHPNND
jgi:hypothetical protein